MKNAVLLLILTLGLTALSVVPAKAFTFLGITMGETEGNPYTNGYAPPSYGGSPGYYGGAFGHPFYRDGHGRYFYRRRDSAVSRKKPAPKRDDKHQ